MSVNAAMDTETDTETDTDTKTDGHSLKVPSKGDDTPVEGKVGTIKRLVTYFNEIRYDLILTIR